MNQSIYKYIHEHFSQHPKDVDKLIVSSFFKIKGIEVKKNKFLKSYIINPANVEEAKKIDTFITLIQLSFQCNYY